MGSHGSLLFPMRLIRVPFIPFAQLVKEVELHINPEILQMATAVLFILDSCHNPSEGIRKFELLSLNPTICAGHFLATIYSTSICMRTETRRVYNNKRIALAPKSMLVSMLWI